MQQFHGGLVKVCGIPRVVNEHFYLNEASLARQRISRGKMWKTNDVAV